MQMWVPVSQQITDSIDDPFFKKGKMLLVAAII